MLRETYEYTVASFKNAISHALNEMPFRERIGIYLGLMVVMLWTLFPFYYMVLTSFSSSEVLYSDTPTLFTTEVTLRNYAVLMLGNLDFPFVRVYFNSILIASVTAALAVFVATMGAYSFTRLEYRGRNLISRGVLLVYMFSGIMVVVPLFRILSSLNLTDSHIGLIVTYTVVTLPVALYMLGNFFRSLEPEIEEAAMIDGYSLLEIIYRVTLPLSVPAIVAVYLFTFIVSWNEYLFARVLLRTESKYTLPLGLETLAGTDIFLDPWGPAMAAAVLITIPVVLFFLYLHRWMIEGLTLE